MTVEPRFKTNQGVCNGRADVCKRDDCPIYGTLGRPALDGRQRVRGCGDPVAVGKRNRTKGDAKARQARKRLRLTGANTRHEEHLGGVARFESKAGAKDGANKVWTAYRNARAQSEAARAIGDIRPFVAAFCPDGTSHMIFAIRDDDLEAFVYEYARLLGFVDG